MQITWTETDIKPGIIVGRPHRNERWMIGYISKVPSSLVERYSLNSMTDGMVDGPYTPAALAERLTAGNEHPAEVLDNPRFEFRKPMPTS